MTDEQELDDSFDGNEDTNSDSGSDGQTGAPPQDKTATKDSGNSDARINGLMSNWQSEQAKNAQLTARIAELEGKSTSNGGNASAQSQDGAQANEFLELAREQARQSLFASDPRLAALGIEVTAIEGNSAKEMQASLGRLRGLIDKVETETKASTLRAHGLSPEISAGSSDKKLDFASMSDEEILKLGDRVLSGI